MLKKRNSDFASLVWKIAARVGNNAPRITDDILKRAYPRTAAEAEIEGADKALRVGVISEVKRILRHGMDVPEQRDFSEIDPAFQGIVGRLKSKSYFVESADEYVSVPRLIAEPALLNEARKFMQQKGMECLAEARLLNELYDAVTGEQEAERDA